MTDIVIVPAAPVVPPFPALGAPNFNQEAYDNGSAMPGVTLRVHEIAVTAHTNATAAKEQALLATNNAAEQVALATTQAELATAQASAAVAAAGAVAWVSGAVYAMGDTRYSPLNLQSYRRKTAGAGALDPSFDTVNWTPLGGVSTAQLHALALSF